jgi:hypothetical protein
MDAHPWSHRELADLSIRCAHLQGTLSTRYSPFRHFTNGIATAFSCDLHASTTPPTFVLSQDQTLQLKILIVNGSADREPNKRGFTFVCSLSLYVCYGRHLNPLIRPMVSRPRKRSVELRGQLTHLILLSVLTVYEFSKSSRTVLGLFRLRSRTAVNCPALNRQISVMRSNDKRPNQPIFTRMRR